MFLCLALVLCGCKKSGEDEDAPEPDPIDQNLYPFNPDKETLGGIQIETNGHPIASLSDIDNWYRQTFECVAAQYFDLGYGTLDEYEAPPIVIEDDLRTLCGNGGPEIYCTGYTIPILGIQTAYAVSAATRETWRHGFLHHILYMNDFDIQMNLNHMPIEIWSCQSYDN